MIEMGNQVEESQHGNQADIELLSCNSIPQSSNLLQRSLPLGLGEVVEGIMDSDTPHIVGFRPQRPMSRLQFPMK